MHGKGKPRHGGGQFRGAVSTYDKRTVIEKQRALKAKKVNKYRKALAKLEAEGRLVAPAAAAPADLDALFLGGGGDDGAQAGQRGTGEAGGGGGVGGQRPKQREKPGDAGQRQAQGRQQVGGAPTSGGGSKRPRPDVGGGSSRDGSDLPLPPPPPEAAGTGEHERAAGGAKRRVHKGAPSQLERLAAKRQAELGQERAEKEERMKEAQRRREELEAKTKQRKDAKAKFFAKTRRGQPVMKHRLDKILGALQAEKAGR